MEEILARLLVRRALDFPDWRKRGVNGEQNPEASNPPAQRLSDILHLATCNANLTAVYSAELSGLVSLLGLGEDDQAGGPLCSSHVGPGGTLPPSIRTPKRGRAKRRPDLVEAAIGEAFEALLMRAGSPARFRGLIDENRFALVDSLLSAALSTEFIFDCLSSGAPVEPDGEGGHPGAFHNKFGALGESGDEEQGQEQQRGEESDVNVPRSPGKAGSTGMSADGSQYRFEAVTDGSSLVGNPPDDSEVAIEGCQTACEEDKRWRNKARILRLYGEKLLKFRVSASLYGSATGKEQGPSELTVRRQRVLSLENLHAVAKRVRASGGGAGTRTPGETAGEGQTETYRDGPIPSSLDWLRTEVARSSLGCNGPAFGCRVVALLLSRAGDRTPRSDCDRSLTTVEEDALQSTGVGYGEGGPDNPVPVAGSDADGPEACGWELLKETQFPRANEKASRILFPQYKLPPKSPLKEGGRTRKRSRDRGRTGDFDCPAETPTQPGKRRREERAPRVATEHDGDDALPLRYVESVGRLPKHTRGLLARVGQEHFVKVFETLLSGFMQSMGASSACPGSSLPPGQLPSAGENRMGSNNVVGSYGGGKGRAGEVENPWKALTSGGLHSSIEEFIKPSRLVRAESDRLILPIPNPFHRCVMHALCLVHGLSSRRGAVEEKGAARSRSAGEHRAVEIRFSRSSVRERGSRSSGGNLVPVETLFKK